MNDHFPLKEETFKIIGICMEIHRILGKGFSEIVYKDALSYELEMHNIIFEREKTYQVNYKQIVLPHNFQSDFVVYNDVILEIKAVKNLNDEHFGQVMNYLAVSKCPIGLLINFGEKSLTYKRIIM